ncbi:MAG: ribonucleotide-diphosphate reductase subunit alpha [Candidatus Omnitrophota bacterium]|nr:MAG: ribonucleotide-diphosphate reductase subunit alpha [Candidatus Omnitrophota bacterium]RKY45512.1 MAG: ribonucleotide-diphosphate reductase subunit alpha [Candidatus Omnitrophota bacterium]
MNDTLNFSPNALLVLKKRYLKKDKEGRVIETPYQLVARVARAIAEVEKRYGASKEVVKEIEQAFFDMMANLEFMPNSPTLMNAGKELGQLSACFVVPVEDSMESIFDAIKATALIHKTGGGTGFSFSRLRSKNSVVRSTGGVASGPVSFMRVFDSATQAVKQGGTRRGANMGILRVDHPDILEFIKCKEKEGEISNFNISVAVTDEFMEKVFKSGEYNLIDPHTKEVKGRLNAKEVFDLIATCAWKNGEPGIVFIDRVNKFNPTLHLGEIESTNPCGEQPLLPYESCNLGSINLAKMVKREEEDFQIDWGKLSKITRLATRFLDNVIDANKFPLPQIKENTLKTRKIGLGVMGWATMLGFLGIPYDSPQALELARRLMKFIYENAKETSILLARERGVFPAWRGSIWEKRGIKIRNATLTTIAPTGSISIIAGPTSTGIEPFYSLVYFRNVLDGEKLMEIEPSFEYIARRGGFYSQDLMEKIAKGESIQRMEEIPQDVKEIFKTALEIEPITHVKMQAAFQEFTDNAVSKTINLSNKAKIEDVKEAFLSAYKLGCKGITVYRDGSRKVQVLTVEKEKEEKVSSKVVVTQLKPRPEVIIGTTTKITTGCGNLYVTVNQDNEGNLFEVFTQMGKAGGCAASQLEAIGRLISLALRGGVDVKVIIEQLKGIRCPSPNWANGKRIFSCADAIARVLEKRAADQKKLVEAKISISQPVGAKLTTSSFDKSDLLSTVIGVCPECGSALRHQEGCVICDSCGYSKC